NSGILFRGRFEPNVPNPTAGIETEVILRPAAPRTGSLFQYVPRQLVHAVVPKDHIRPAAWFTLEVQAVGSRVVTLIDGKAVVDCLVPAQGPRRGPLALQHTAGGTVVDFRKVDIKELPKDSPWSTITGKAAVPEAGLVARAKQQLREAYKAELA